MPTRKPRGAIAVLLFLCSLVLTPATLFDQTGGYRSPRSRRRKGTSFGRGPNLPTHVNQAELVGEKRQCPATRQH